MGTGLGIESAHKTRYAKAALACQEENAGNPLAGVTWVGVLLSAFSSNLDLQTVGGPISILETGGKKRRRLWLRCVLCRRSLRRLAFAFIGGTPL
jgi:hypothetical protein